MGKHLRRATSAAHGAAAALRVAGRALRYSHRLNGNDSLNLTKLDVMTGLPHIKICTHYRIGGCVCVL